MAKFTFNRSEQLALIFLAVVLLVGTVITFIDRYQPDRIEEFSVLKQAVPVPSEAAIDQSESASQTLLKINLNQASAKELQRLPRIGPKVAERIIAYREKNGPFQTLEDLTKIQGIGPKTIEQFRSQVILP